MRKTLIESLVRRPFTESLPLAADPEIARMACELDNHAQRRLGRSLSLRLVDAGSCNACELELNALSNPFYDLERFGLKFVASPRHADVLLVTGPVTKNMGEALIRTYNAMPAPKWVVAVGDCAVCGGLFGGSYACHGGAAAVVPVDIHISGCPPAPAHLLEGLLSLFITSRSSDPRSTLASGITLDSTDL
jgi:Ni,Fe-hydrogenase III small subunit